MRLATAQAIARTNSARACDLLTVTQVAEAGRAQMRRSLPGQKAVEGVVIESRR